MKILIVEDDDRIAAFLEQGFVKAGFEAKVCSDGLHGLDALLTETFDAAILDMMLPRASGLEILERARAQNIKTPVLFLSAKGSVEDKVTALQKGGDDYVVKPFVFAEALERVKALVRRSRDNSVPTMLEVGPIQVNLISRQVVRSGKAVTLQPREYALLELLLRNAGHIVSRQMILQSIWNYDLSPDVGVIDVLASRLRQKIDRDFPDKLIQTVRGGGYVLKPE